MSGTPEKILEHLLETVKLDSQFTEPGTLQCIQRNMEMVLLTAVHEIHGEESDPDPTPPTYPAPPLRPGSDSAPWILCTAMRSYWKYMQTNRGTVMNNPL